MITSLKHLAFILKCKTSQTELQAICDQLSTKDYSFDSKYYREKIEESIKSNGQVKKRIINPCKGRLKQIQNHIKKNIFDHIHFPMYVQGAQRGRSNITNAACHLGNKYKFTTDIKRFFPTITPLQVYQAFCEYGYKPDISRTMTLLCTYKGRVPQGASTSAHLANFVFLKTDKGINDICAKNGLTYTRYIDDITISSQKDFKEIVPDVISEINNAGFVISSPKTFYRHVLDVTGITVGNNNMRPNDKFFKRLDQEQNEASKLARLQYLHRVKSAKK